MSIDYSEVQRIVVTNAKGGCGKTTIATNLAGYFASCHRKTVLFDYDPQGSSMHWLKQRSDDLLPVHGIAAARAGAAVTRSWQLRLPVGTEKIISDTPAGLSGIELVDMVQRADAILIPVCPSPIDIHACARFVRDLLIVGKARSYGVRIGVIANRVKPNTLTYVALKKFLDTMKIPFITSLRDTQNYSKAAERGISVHELRAPKIEKDIEQWAPVYSWLRECDDEGPSLASHYHPVDVAAHLKPVS
ncbi:MAG: ParA family protein [Gammaproteobacteria bacterium]|nr:ParA family protein [Gammaproteobacteria bacterium]